MIALMALETGLSLSVAAWRPGVVEPAVAFLVSFWSATVLVVDAMATMLLTAA